MDGSGNNGGGGGDSQQQQQQQQQVAQRPEYVPEKYWDGEKGAPRLEAMSAGIKELETKLGKGRETFEAERLAKRPATANDYKFTVPTEGPMFERLSKANLVLMDKAPGADFKPEDGKQYFVLDPKSPLLEFWRGHAHNVGLSNDEFMGGVMQFAEVEAARQQRSAESIRGEIDGEMKKLGEHGRERANFAFDRLNALLGDKAKALDFIKVDAAGTEAIEALLEKLGEPKFSPGQGGDGKQVDKEALTKEAKELQNSQGYWQDEKKQARVAEIYKLIYPGQVETAASTGFGR